MQNDKIFALIGAIAVIGSVACDHMIPQLPIPKPRLMPIEIMPRNLGGWQAGPDRAVDPEVQHKLTTAKIMDRIYTNPMGQQIELLLVTADDREDIHNPMVCFPSQGWQIRTLKSFQLNGSNIHPMTAAQGGIQFDVFYWLSGYFGPPPPANPLLRRVVAIRKKLVGPFEGMSLIVRLMADHSPDSEQMLKSFTAQIMPVLQQMESRVRNNERS